MKITFVPTVIGYFHFVYLLTIILTAYDQYLKQTPSYRVRAHRRCKKIYSFDLDEWNFEL